MGYQLLCYCLSLLSDPVKPVPPHCTSDATSKTHVWNDPKDSRPSAGFHDEMYDRPTSHSLTFISFSELFCDFGIIWTAHHTDLHLLSQGLEKTVQLRVDLLQTHKQYYITEGFLMWPVASVPLKLIYESTEQWHPAVQQVSEYFWPVCVHFTSRQIVYYIGYRATLVS